MHNVGPIRSLMAMKVQANLEADNRAPTRRSARLLAR
jgi:hypothetical protein